MDRTRNFFLLIATLALAGLLTVACDSGTQEPAADPSEAAMPVDGADNMTSESEESAAMLDGADDFDASIPEAFPEEVPIYPGSNTAQGKGAVLDGVPIAAVQLRTNDSPEDVYDFYAKKFARDGWTIESDGAMRDKNAVSATNGECKVTMLATPAPDGGTGIFIVTEC